jgi:hypothetical protein
MRQLTTGLNLSTPTPHTISQEIIPVSGLIPFYRNVSGSKTCLVTD